jgi:hypothetical protein
MPERNELGTRERRRDALEWTAVICDPHTSEVVVSHLIEWLDDWANRDTFCRVFEVMQLIEESETAGLQAESEGAEVGSDELLISAEEHERYCKGLEWYYALENPHLTKDAWHRYCEWQRETLNEAAFDFVADVMELSIAMHWPGQVVPRAYQIVP